MAKRNVEVKMPPVKGARKKSPEKLEWEEKFLERIHGTHKRQLSKVVTRILKRASTTKHSMTARSAKLGVFCDITAEDITQLMYDAYGTKCKYCDKIISINTLVIDHIIPISKGGISSKDNLQVICKTSNCMKGSLSEDHFNILLQWLETVPIELKKDIYIRLSRGIH